VNAAKQQHSTAKSGKRLLRILGAGLLIIALTVAVTLALLDVRPIVENQVSAITQRSLSINGEFDLEVGTDLKLYATDVVWQNSAASELPYMLTIGTVNARISIAELFSGRLVLEDVSGDEVELLLEWFDDAPMNWVLSDADPADSKPLPESLPLYLRKARLTNSKVTLAHPDLTAPIEIDIGTAGHIANDNDDIVLNAQTTVDERPIAWNAVIGPFPKLVVAGEINYDIQAEGSNGAIAVTGDIENLASLTDPHLELRLKANDANIVLEQLNLGITTIGGIDLIAEIDQDDGRLVTDVKGNVGQLELSVDARASDLTMFEDFALSVEANGPNAANLGMLVDIEGLPETPFVLDIKAKRTEDGLRLHRFNIESDGLTVNTAGVARKLPELRNIDLTVDLQTDNLQVLGGIAGVSDLPMLPVTASANIISGGEGSPDKLTASATIGNTRINADGFISEQANFAGSEVLVSLASQNLQTLLGHFGSDSIAAVPGSVSGKLLIEEQSINIRQGLANVDGNLIDFTADVPRSDPSLLASGQLSAAGDSLFRLTGLFNVNTAALNDARYAIDTGYRLQSSRLELATSGASFDDTRLGFDGNVSWSSGISVAGNVSVSGDNLSELPLINSLAQLPAQAFDASANIALDTESIAASDILLTVADNQLSGSISSGFDIDEQPATIDLSGSGSNLRELVGSYGNYSSPDRPFKLRFTGEIGTQSVVIEKLSATVGTATADVAGELVFAPKIWARDISVDMRGQDSTDLGEVALWEPIGKPFSVVAKLTGDDEEASIENLKLTFGDSDLDGRLYLKAATNDTELTFLQAELDSERLNLGPVLNAPETTDTDDDGKVFSAEPFNFSGLQKLDAGISINIGHLLSDTREMKNLRLQAELKDGLLSVGNISGDTRRGNVQGTFVLDSATQPATLRGQIKGTDVATVVADIGEDERDNLPDFALNADFNTQGDSAAQMAAALNGHFWVVISEGVAPPLEYSLIVGDFISELFALLNPFAKEETTTMVRCGGIYLEAVDGIVETAPAMLVQTDKISIGATGGFDLRRERIDLVLNSTPLKGIGISASEIVNPLIKLGGTLSEPRVTLNPTDAAIKGTAAVATMGLSIVGSSLWKRWVRSKNACAKVQEKATEIRQGKDPDSVPEWIMGWFD